jgi:hypothetical protein
LPLEVVEVLVILPLGEVVVELLAVTPKTSELAVALEELKQPVVLAAQMLRLVKTAVRFKAVMAAQTKALVVAVATMAVAEVLNKAPVQAVVDRLILVA